MSADATTPTHLAIEYATEGAFDASARGFGAVAPASAPHRFTFPGDVVLSMAVAVNHAFDALRLLAAAEHGEDPRARLTCAAVIHERLSEIHEALLAVVGETAGEVTHGSSRPC